MSRKLKIEEMDAAFKRAAHKALHGTREERSGRFRLDMDRPMIAKNPPSSRGRDKTRRKG